MEKRLRSFFETFGGFFVYFFLGGGGGRGAIFVLFEGGKVG
jgi:hypothetical protein